MVKKEFWNHPAQSVSVEAIRRLAPTNITVDPMYIVPWFLQSPRLAPQSSYHPNFAFSTLQVLVIRLASPSVSLARYSWKLELTTQLFSRPLISLLSHYRAPRASFPIQIYWGNWADDKYAYPKRVLVVFDHSFSSSWLVSMPPRFD
jgi:hypothetical protein